MLYGAEFAVCSEINTKQKKTQCGQTVQFLIVTPVGARNQSALKG